MYIQFQSRREMKGYLVLIRLRLEDDIEMDPIEIRCGVMKGI
jgi:hypothetical protein